jgi:hypothetical protein
LVQITPFAPFGRCKKARRPGQPLRQKIQIVREGEYPFGRFRYQLSDEVMATRVSKVHPHAQAGYDPYAFASTLLNAPSYTTSTTASPCRRTGCELVDLPAADAEWTEFWVLFHGLRRYPRVAST